MSFAKFRSIFIMSLFAGILIVSLSHCATDKELEVRSLNRFLSEGTYRNTIKGFSMNWPNDQIWKYKDSPEFDLGFDHVNGKSQFFVVGVRGLIRRDFPQGFAEWILERLQARDIEFTDKKDLSSEEGEFYKYFLNSTFMILPRNQFGVERKVCIYAKKQDPFWVAVIYISPEDAFDEYLPEVDEIVKTVNFLSE